ncbi:Hpt domain-containing protein [Anianabacter salinae]|uniref:Hpt domain-containing protein n=1 Tax=Anianabacter salinae TaxID=2851023 RepID=UPI00225DD687|nr:Hpt domain-containing protein [Anianabacter salinae]MBV0913536.1 Hpt domain-containing protein [Anianabacter salinae]
MIDWTRVNDLRFEIGEDGFPEVVELFLEEVEEVMARLLSAGDAADEDLHFLKGSALNLGFAELARLCDTGTGTVADLAACYDQSKAEFLAKAGLLAA